MSNKFKIKSRARTYTFSAPILMFEKKCFDWHFSGKDRTVVDDGYEATDHGDHITVKHKSHVVKRAWLRGSTDLIAIKRISFSALPNF